MKHTILALLCVLAFTLNSAFANEDPANEAPSTKGKGTISGSVTDQQSGSAMEYVNVVIYSEVDSALVTGVITDEKGQFSLEKIPQGKYYLKIQFLGYKSHFLKDIEITREKTIYDVGDIKLSPGNNEIAEVQVVADKRHVEYRIDKKIINPSQDIIASGGSAVQVLENAPSINVDIQGNVSMRNSTNFKVLIDGKETLLEGSEALRSIPASSIEKIELITNPSAKYEADGTAGIINVILKKNTKLGLNGVIDFSVNNRGTINSNIQLSYKPNKVNYHFKLRPVQNKWEYFREQSDYTLPELNPISKFNSSYEGNYREFYTMIGADIEFSEKSSLSFSAGNSWVDMTMNDKHEGIIYDLGSTGAVTTIDQAQKPIRPESNLVYDRVFDKPEHKLTLMGHYSSWDGNHLRELSNYSTDATFNLNGVASDTSIYADDINVNHYYKFRADYVRPLENGMTLETGFQSTHTLRIAEYDIRGGAGNIENVVKNEDLSFTSDYIRFIQAAYVTVSGELVKIQYKLGARAEYTDRTFEFDDSDPVDYNNLQVFPSVHLSRQLPNNQQLSASYSKRITRPQSFMMYAYPIYTDGNTIEMGDYNIIYEKGNSYEIGYNVRFKKFNINTEAFYRDVYDPINRIQLRDEVNDLTVIQLVNFDRQQSGGVELSLNVTPAQWIRIDVRGSDYFQRIDQNDHEEVNKVARSNEYNINGNVSLMFKSNTRVQLYAGYSSASQTVQGTREGQLFNGFGVSQSFFNHKLSINAGVWNLFNTAKWENTSDMGDVRRNYKYTVDRPFIHASISYRFNNYKPQKSVNFEESNYNSGQYD
jgi:outer membrane receptor protein involved in Fe transport